MEWQWGSGTRVTLGGNRCHGICNVWAPAAAAAAARAVRGWGLLASAPAPQPAPALPTAGALWVCPEGLDAGVIFTQTVAGRQGGLEGVWVPVLCDCTLIMRALCCVAPLQKNAIAVAHCKKGKGVLNINGYPIDGLLPESMRYKVFEPVLLVGNDKFKDVDIRVKVRGGGNTSQIFGEHFFFLRCTWFACLHRGG